MPRWHIAASNGVVYTVLPLSEELAEVEVVSAVDSSTGMGCGSLRGTAAAHV